MYFDPLMILRWIYIRALSKYLYLKGFIVVSSFGSSNRIIFCCCAAIVVGVSRVHAKMDTVQLQLWVVFFFIKETNSIDFSFSLYVAVCWSIWETCMDFALWSHFFSLLSLSLSLYLTRVRAVVVCTLIQSIFHAIPL